MGKRRDGRLNGQKRFLRQTNKERKKERMGLAKQRKAMQSVNYALKANKNGSGLLKKGKKENDDLLVDLLVCLV